MDTIIVICAGCGSQFRGNPGLRKYKCPACFNLFTFPSGARTADPGARLCSNCWSSFSAQQSLANCPICCQKFTPNCLGKALTIDGVLRTSGRVDQHDGAICAELRGLALPHQELEA